MAVIWGLDLKEMQWGKFKSSNMWNNEYHLRRTKFIIYQLAMILCVVSESLGTAALSDYVDQQDFASSRNAEVMVHNNNFIGIASFNIFVGIYVATIFGSAFFFDLFWPERKESHSVKLAWKICSVLACMLTLACALAYTEILATRGAYVTGADSNEVNQILADFKKSKETPLQYNKNARAVASVVFLWPGMIFTFASTYLLWRSIDHIDQYGPKSTHARTRDEVINPSEKPLDSGSAADLTAPDHEGLAQPEKAHARPDGNVNTNGDAHGRAMNAV